MVEKQTHEKDAAAPAKSPARKRPATQADRPMAVKQRSAEPAPAVQALPAAARTPLSPAEDEPARVLAKPARLKKSKPVRDTFTMPRNEYELIDLLKRRAHARGRKVKKSELLRAGILALADMPDAQLFEAIAAVPPLREGRPQTTSEPQRALGEKS